MDCIVSKEMPIDGVNQYGDYRDFSIELEHSLLRVFQQESVNQSRLEEARKLLMNTGPCEAALFDHLDYDSKGFLIFADVENFIRSKHRSLTVTKVERTWRRLEPDFDGRVHYRKFLRAIRPTSFYPAYTSHYLSNKSMSPSRKFRSRSPNRESSKVLESTLLSNVSLRKSKTPARMNKETYQKKNKDWEVMEESYRQAVEREIGTSERNQESPVKRLSKVPKKYYSKNVNRFTLQSELENSISNSPARNERRREASTESLERRELDRVREFVNTDNKLSKTFLSSTPNYMDNNQAISSIKKNTSHLKCDWSPVKKNNPHQCDWLDMNTNKEVYQKTEPALITSQYYTTPKRIYESNTQEKETSKAMYESRANEKRLDESRANEKRLNESRVNERRLNEINLAKSQAKQLVPLVDASSEYMRDRHTVGVYDKSVNNGIQRSPSKVIREELFDKYDLKEKPNTVTTMHSTGAKKRNNVSYLDESNAESNKRLFLSENKAGNQNMPRNESRLIESSGAEFLSEKKVGAPRMSRNESRFNQTSGNEFFTPSKSRAEEYKSRSPAREIRKSIIETFDLSEKPNTITASPYGANRRSTAKQDRVAKNHESDISFKHNSRLVESNSRIAESNINPKLVESNVNSRLVESNVPDLRLIENNVSNSRLSRVTENRTEPVKEQIKRAHKNCLDSAPHVDDSLCVFCHHPVEEDMGAYSPDRSKYNLYESKKNTSILKQSSMRQSPGFDS